MRGDKREQLCLHGDETTGMKLKDGVLNTQKQPSAQKRCTHHWQAPGNQLLSQSFLHCACKEILNPLEMKFGSFQKHLARFNIEALFAFLSIARTAKQSAESADKMSIQAPWKQKSVTSSNTYHFDRCICCVLTGGIDDQRQASQPKIQPRHQNIESLVCTSTEQDLSNLHLLTEIWVNICMQYVNLHVGLALKVK